MRIDRRSLRLLSKVISSGMRFTKSGVSGYLEYLEGEADNLLAIVPAGSKTVFADANTKKGGGEIERSLEEDAFFISSSDLFPQE